MSCGPLTPLVGTDDRVLSSEERASWWYTRLDEALVNRGPFYERARDILADLKSEEQENGHYCMADLSHSLPAGPVDVNTENRLASRSQLRLQMAA